MIKGISIIIIQHRIHLIEKTKPIRDPQCRLSPIMKEVVSNDILECLDNGIIYLISDSSWVRLIHVVLKKLVIAVIQKDSNEFVLTCIQIG